MLIVLSPDCLGKFSVSLERWWIISLYETHRSGQWTGNPRDGGANEWSSLLQSHLQLIEFLFPRRQIKTSGPWEGNYHSNIPHGNTLTRQIRGSAREDRDVKKRDGKDWGRKCQKETEMKRGKWGISGSSCVWVCLR